MKFCSDFSYIRFILPRGFELFLKVSEIRTRFT